MRFGIWRSAEAPSDSAEKNGNIGAQLQSLACIKAPKLFWEIYFLYDISRAQSCSLQAAFRCTNFDNSCKRRAEKNIYMHILGPKLLQWNLLQISQLSYTNCGAQNFPPNFGLFAIFYCNFAKKNVAPSSDKHDNYVVHLKALSFQKKVENRIKIDPLTIRRIWLNSAGDFFYVLENIRRKFERSNW